MKANIHQSTTKAVRRTISRGCSICGKKMRIKIFEDSSYAPGNYFCKLEKGEYWECDTCFNDE